MTTSTPSSDRVSVSFTREFADELARILRHEVKHADEHHSTEQTLAVAATRLETAVEQSQDTDTASWTHPDWEYGTACPSCGCHVFHVVQASGEKYRAESNEFVYVDHTPYRDDLHIECDECQTTVYTTTTYTVLHSHET